MELPLNELLMGECSPGMLFNLEAEQLLSKLYELEEMNCIKINRTAGSDVIRLLDNQLTDVDVLAKYYEMIG